MRHSLRNILLVTLLAVSLRPARAFSLLGPPATWETTEIGYMLSVVFVAAGDIGAPMNLGEEYRWNLPLITYGFDESFLNFFGEKGVEEVEKAIKILNDLPAFSQMSADLSEFPLDTRRFNYQANALYLVDMKSFILGALLEQLGLAPPERYTWTLRSRVVIDNIPVYVVTKRNFDPITFEPSPYVNGTLYTYQVLHTYTNPDVYEAVEFEVDPSLPSVTSVAASMINGGTVLAAGYFVNSNPGLFYTGLTRDDVAGLRYIYRPQNLNVETVVSNAVVAPLSTTPGNYLLQASTGGSPWGPPPGITNVVSTNALPVSQALRPGVDKITFVRVDFDSMVGAWVPVTNVFLDYFITNGVRHVQLLQRPLLTGPDILFGAADLGITTDGFPIMATRTSGWLDQDAINGATALAGPGQVLPPITITLSQLGEYLMNSPEGGQADGIPDFWWGSYDGTTNAPVVYPVGASIKALERMVMSGQVDATPSPWRSPYGP